MEKITHSHSVRTDIRQRHKQLRAQMMPSEVRDKSKSICERLLKEVWYQECELIYGYYPLGNEVNCLAFLEQALSEGKRVALPRMWDGEKDSETDKMMQNRALMYAYHMDFYEITSLEQVTEGGFHVMEPTAECPLLQESQAIVLVPGVVFDKSGNRYGYGKGYYDRYFARYKDLYKIALAYENQIEQTLSVLDTDVRMNCVCTEAGIYEC